VALIIGNLKSISSTESRVPITVYAPAGQELNGYHALEVAVKGLQFYEDIFNCRYPLPKLDLVAMPDLSSGAMENWGLIIFKPVELLLEPMGSSLSRRQRVTEIVLHEISHQWFGNLVTMKYWDSLWLNEGFATWMAKFASNHFYPQWHVWQDFVADTLQQGLELDALRSSHPVERLVRDAGEAEQAYDNIAYRKGSSILRMIAKDLGEKRFLDGIKLYLERHRLGNTVTEDLWIALGDATQQNVKATMAVWAERIGFPVVTITENSSDEAGNDSGEAGEVKIILTQSRFLAAGDTRPDEDATAYPLRISIRTSDNHCKYFDFNEREMKISIAETKFYKVNVDHTGFYRTAYPTQRLRSFGEAARLGLLSTEDKVGIVADAVALAASGSQQTSGLFDLFQGMKSEDEYLVWSQIAKGIKNIRTAWRFQPDLIVRGLKKFAAEIFGSRALEVGWVIQDDDDETMQLFKPLLLDAAGSAGVVE
jgi:aminopeptidase 2